MKRQIIEIDQEKCIGCGLCANACQQGAIQVIDGKAKLVSDSYCDGLGMCLPSCPVDAIKLTEQDAKPFDQNRKGFATKKKEEPSACGCPGTAAMAFGKPIASSPKIEVKKQEKEGEVQSQLQQWPVQLHLISENAPYLEGANLLIAADCCAFAYGNFHQEFIKGKITMIGCPKLDDVEPYIQKLANIFATRNIASVTVTRMSVPCCGGITRAVKEALSLAGKVIPYAEVTITPEGKLQF